VSLWQARSPGQRSPTVRLPHGNAAKVASDAAVALFPGIASEAAETPPNPLAQGTASHGAAMNAGVANATVLPTISITWPNRA
jgi:hypothetical protein